MPFFCYCVIIDSFADVAKLVDALDLGSSAERRESSSLSIRTSFLELLKIKISGCLKRNQVSLRDLNKVQIVAI